MSDFVFAFSQVKSSRRQSIERLENSRKLTRSESRPLFRLLNHRGADCHAKIHKNVSHLYTNPVLMASFGFDNYLLSTPLNDTLCVESSLRISFHRSHCFCSFTDFMPLHNLEDERSGLFTTKWKFIKKRLDREIASKRQTIVGYGTHVESTSLAASSTSLRKFKDNCSQLRAITTMGFVRGWCSGWILKKLLKFSSGKICKHYFDFSLETSFKITPDSIPIKSLHACA